MAKQFNKIDINRNQELNSMRKQLNAHNNLKLKRLCRQSGHLLAAKVIEQRLMQRNAHTPLLYRSINS